jgi:hypothetical protein
MRASAILWAAFALPGLLPLMITKRRRLIARLRTLPALLLLSGACVWFTGCGGNSGKSSGSVPPVVTPSGNYAIQVIASGPAGVNTSTAVALTVQ